MGKNDKKYITDSYRYKSNRYKLKYINKKDIKIEIIKMKSHILNHRNNITRPRALCCIVLSEYGIC